MTAKKNIALVWGGYTSEIVVSKNSMENVYTILDKELYDVYKVKIDRNEWTADVDGAIYPIDKNDFSFTSKSGKINFDFAFIVIHGSPGEDGRLQGYLDMMRIPYSSCGTTASALTMNKYICNKYLQNFGIKIAESVVLKSKENIGTKKITEQLGLPVFVKPNSGGSSFATTKVKSEDKLTEAIENAFAETDEVIIESFVSGTEVTCGCFKTKDKLTVLPLTEVVTKNEFFDYDAKYNGQVEEITPARIDNGLANFIRNQTLKIYELIEAKGIIRADYIIHDNIPFLLEVNTVPGMTHTSFIPQQIRAAGLNIAQVFSDIIEYEYSKNKR
ncbi:MAG: D-alanine--D-alanine ligase [Dysgonomonas sp.]